MPENGITVGFILPGGKYISWIFEPHSLIEVFNYPYTPYCRIFMIIVY